MNHNCRVIYHHHLDPGTDPDIFERRGPEKKLSALEILVSLGGFIEGQPGQPHHGWG